MQIPLGEHRKFSIYIKNCLATIGVCVFGAPATIGAFFYFGGGFEVMIVCVPLELVGIVLFFAIIVGGYSIGYLLDWFAHWWWVIGICSLVRCVLMGIFLEKNLLYQI